MTLADIENVLRLVQFPLYIFHAKEAGGRFWLQATFYAECSETREVKRQHTRKWYVSRECTPSQVVQTALKCVLASVEHEAREAFTYRGRPIFGPHFDVDRLAAMFDEGDPLARRAPVLQREELKP